MSVTTLTEGSRVARKPHGCSVCLGVIAAGDTYLFQKNADGERLWTWKAHPLCSAVMWQLWEPYVDDDGTVDPFEVRWVLTDVFRGLGALIACNPRSEEP